MHLVRYADAIDYQPSDHIGVLPRRLQGRDAGGPQRLAVSLSQYPPGSGSDHLVPAPGDLVYVVVAGEIEVEHETGIAQLSYGDSVSFTKGEKRAARNSSAEPATLVVIHQDGPTE